LPRVIAPKRATALGTLVVAGLAGAGVVVATGSHGGSAKAAGTFVAAERGRVSVTVGGIGHVTTLSSAARLTVPAAAGPAPASGGSSAQASSTAAIQVPGDAVFATVPAHVSRVLVHTGQFLLAGEPIATLVDDGTLATQELQASSDLATARLELAQKRVQDPARGPQPTPAEVQAGRQNIVAAQAKLHRLLGPPLPADVALARSDLAKTFADLQTARRQTPAATNAAELAVAAAQQQLQTLTGAPNPVDVAAAQLELARATLDQETTLRPPPAPTPAAIAAADAAIALAQQRLADAQASGTAADVAAARAELAKAQADREALFITPLPPTQAARAAAQLAVDAAQRRLADLLNPPASVASAARTDVAKAEADLEALRLAHGIAATTAARAAVAAAKARLGQVTGHPTRDVVAAARLDLSKAKADLAVLGQRGSPATPTDLALARLKVDVAGQRLALARRMGARLVVHAPATGTVTSILTTQGAAVDAATPLARVQDLRHLVVALDLSEFDVGKTRVGARAQVGVDALAGERSAGASWTSR
jgi:multidrug resistance efflux pump